MKFPLLTTTLLATSQFKPAGDLVKPDYPRLACLIARTREENLNPVMARLLAKQPSQVACAMLKSLSSRPRTCAAPQAKPTPAKVELPPTPASNPLARFDYRKGDDASTVQKFAKAVKNEFTVTSNEAAKNPETFRKNPIMVYGEDHRQPVIPSLRTPRGVLLLESNDPNRCLPKHVMHKANQCISIDKSKLDMVPLIESCYRRAKKALDLIKPGEAKRIEDQVNKNGGQATAYLNEALQFIDKSTDAAIQRCHSNMEAEKLLEAVYSFYDSVNEFNSILTANRNGGKRDLTMLRECNQAISQLPENASASIVVGAVHAPFLANELAKKYPERAVVLATYAHGTAKEIVAEAIADLKGTVLS